MSDNEVMEEFKVEFCGLFVNVYLEDRAYGGPEEGGWWFDTGSPVKSKQYLTKEEAEAAKIEQQVWCDAQNEAEGRRWDTGSVLSIGQYKVYIEDEPAAAFPKEWPHYE